jgi:hypothetical protein
MANLLRIIVGVLWAASAVAAAVAGLQGVVPTNSPLAVWLGIAALAAAAVKEVAVVIGDYIDNGKRDNSFKG